MFSKDRANLRGNKSKWYLIGSSLLVVVMGYFLSTNMFLEDELEVLASPIGEEIGANGQRDVEILEWIYDENNETMQVILDIKDMRFAVDKLDVQAVQRSTMSPVEVNISYEIEEYMVLDIKNFDHDFEQISLQLYEIEMSENEQEERSGIVNLYTDYREVEHRDIDEKDQQNYFEYVMDTLINNAEEEIEIHHEEILGIEQNIIDIEDEIQSIKEEKQYQTAEEKVHTDNHINSLEVQKESYISNQNELDERIKLEKERIENYENRKRNSSISLSN
ncbi:hypothetical protein ABC345_20975 [Shouchella sp. 1P09AA]|uniref:hypothetical protein n=1 Tax=unclassified Shouchella TaxID=2893065 RepID=UPI0039A23D33